MNEHNWTGEMWLRPGFGMFRGVAGDNSEHVHCAHQIAIGLQGDVEIYLAQRRVRARGLAIPARMPHCLVPADVLLIYLDPLTVEGRSLVPERTGMERVLPSSLCDQLLDACHSPETLRHTLLEALGLPARSDLDQRLVKVISTLETSLTGGTVVERRALASEVGLSPSRFSHWFVDQTGMPLRIYRKWLRLVVALHRAARSANFTEAAHAAGFSDSAHFSRTFRQTFGVNPLAALSRLKLRTDVTTPFSPGS